jgi:3-deoxy-D-manno-octulosonate 8-phosphate phosphatase (KDO 8-P phosphatase)
MANEKAMNAAQVRDVAGRFYARGAEFLSPPEEIAQVHAGIRAYAWDWDGVFNNGYKHGEAGSPFGEADSMGLNLLRFAYWLRYDKLPYVAIITGEPNQAAQMLARREHLHAVYFKMKDKREALAHLTYNNQLTNEQVAYTFDDVLDLSLAAEAGLCMLVRRAASPMLEQYVRAHNLGDYITANEGGHHAVREVCELLMGLDDVFDAVVTERAAFSPRYQAYLYERNQVATHYYTRDDDGNIVESHPSLGKPVKGLGA